MSAQTIVALAGYAIQFGMVGLMGWLLRGYHQDTRREFVYWWSLSWLALGVYLIGAAMALFASQVSPVHPARLVASLASQLGGYFQLVWLLVGTWALVGRPVPSRHVLNRISIAVGVVATLAAVSWAWDPDASTVRLALRVGVRSVAASVVYVVCAWWVLRGARGRGRRLLGASLALYALEHLHYVAVGLVGPLVLGRIVPYTTYLGMVDTFLQLVVGLGMVLCLLEEQLEHRVRAEARRAGIVESTLDAVVTIDAEGRITDWNPQAEAIFGWTSAEVIGTPLSESIIPEEFRDAHEAGLSHFLTTGEGPVLNQRLRLSGMTSEGDRIPIELTITPMQTSDGWEFSGFLRDLSREEELERQLRQSQKIEALGRLAGGIAHDFNNLLTVILGHSELLAQRAPNREAGELPREIATAARRGADLVSQLMTYSRQEIVAPEPLDPSTLLDESIAMLRRLLPESIEVAVHVDEGLPHVVAERGAIQRIVLNLATNARDAMPNGGRIDVGLMHGDDAAGARVLLVVEDSGSGMDETDLSRALDPFYTTKRPGEGTGLGLAVVHGLIEEMGATIQLISTPGAGTRIVIGLRIAD